MLNTTGSEGKAEVNYPEWLESLVTLKILSAKDIETIKELFCMACSIVKKVKEKVVLPNACKQRGWRDPHPQWNSQPRASSFKRSFTVPKFDVIQRNFRNYEQAKRIFKQNFPEWRDVRRRNIASLKSIADDLHRKKHQSNMNRVGGSMTSAAGGVASIVGAVLSPFTFGLSTPLTIMGTALIGYGTCATVSNSVSEFRQQQDSLMRAKEKLEQEERLYKAISGFIDSPNDILDNLCRAIPVRNADGLRDLLKVFADAAKTVLSTPGVVRLIARTTIKCPHIPNSELPETVCLIMALALQFRQEGLWDDYICSFFKTTFVVRGLASGLFRVSSDLGKWAAAKATAGKVLTRGLYSSVGVALDVLTIHNTVEDIKGGSLSEEGKKLEDTAEYLENELVEIEKLYNTLVKNNGERHRRYRQANLLMNEDEEFFPRRFYP